MKLYSSSVATRAPEFSIIPVHNPVFCSGHLIFVTRVDNRVCNRTNGSKAKDAPSHDMSDATNQEFNLFVCRKCRGTYQSLIIHPEDEKRDPVPLYRGRPLASLKASVPISAKRKKAIIKQREEIITDWADSEAQHILNTKKIRAAREAIEFCENEIRNYRNKIAHAEEAIDVLEKENQQIDLEHPKYAEKMRQLDAEQYGE